MTSRDRRPSSAWLALLALAACAGPPEGAPGHDPASGEVSADGGPPAPPPDSHAAHRAYQGRAGAEAAAGACSTCHHDLHSPAVVFDPDVVLPGGTALAGGTAVSGGGGATCSVACHAPFGAPARPVEWGRALACRDCHATVRPTGAARRSSHDPIFSDVDPASGVAQPPAAGPDPTWCWSCHDRAAAQHASGAVRLRPREALEQACLDCHSGGGQTLRTAAGPGYVEAAPPVVQGWQDPAGGDWHGARAGTGFSGTLKPPYAPGQGPLPCLACHAVHASDNVFLLAPAVNGAAIAPASIGRSGVGAQALCNACHSPDRHASCGNPAGGCHTDNQDPNQRNIFYPGNPVDPMPDGSPCFWCHGHEGMRNWTRPDSLTHRGPQNGPTCHHCHSPTTPGPDPGVPPAVATGRLSADIPFYATPAPPVPLLPGGTVLETTSSTAVVYWETDARATSFVEWGAGTAGRVTGALDARCDPDYGLPCRANFHTVVLSGLEPATTYAFRVRSSDDFRNTVEGPLSSFTTLGPQQPPAPRLVPRADLALPLPAPPEATVTLGWLPAAAPDDHPAEYRAQLATDPAFGASVIADTGWTSATSTAATVQLPEWPAQAGYHWRVMARDAVSGLRSPWSLVHRFSAWRYDPG